LRFRNGAACYFFDALEFFHHSAKCFDGESAQIEEFKRARRMNYGLLDDSRMYILGVKSLDQPRISHM
jgi:hypothetical protein